MRRALAEYTVGGIKTTLPFFREVMRDEEFVAGRLDTGFIERFNLRRAAAVAAVAAEAARRAEPDEGGTESHDATTVTTADAARDIAIIAAALAASPNAQATTDGDQPATDAPSQWRVMGRIAQHRSRDLS
jgi:acetyl/propionyl-CoA carboxylase alpha subunit